MNITIEALAKADVDTVWEAWSNPDDVQQWNAASDDWHTPHAAVDFREGGTFLYRMEAKDGSMGFDFTGTYTRIAPKQLVVYVLGDGREVTNEFIEDADGVRVRVTFAAESELDPELQRQGWQAILDNFARYVATKSNA